MNAYIYQAALLCEGCGEEAQATIQQRGGPDWQNTVPVGPDHYPQGPYPDGGGEADCPQHCDSCGLFLKNPLTSDGEDYVRAEVARCVDVNDVARTLWAPFYYYLFR